MTRLSAASDSIFAFLSGWKSPEDVRNPRESGDADDGSRQIHLASVQESSDSINSLERGSKGIQRDPKGSERIERDRIQEPGLIE